MDPQSDLRIPYDIFTLIFDKLASEASEPSHISLSACSQTCRLLLHPCRVHLFSVVEIHKYNASTFVALLKRNSTIPKYIQELNYRSHSQLPMSQDVADVILLLNNVKTLNCADYDWKLLPPSTQHAFNHLLSSPSMSTFSIHDVLNFPLALLANCPTLKHWVIINCVFSTEACDNILGAPPQLLSLELSNNYSSGSGPLLESLPELKRANGLPLIDFSSLRSLTVSVHDSWEEERLGNFLRLTPKLDYLTCSGIHCAFISLLLTVPYYYY